MADKVPTVDDAVSRLQAYIERRKKARAIDIEVIHAFDTGPDCGVDLLLSDIETVVATALAAKAKRVNFDEAWDAIDWSVWRTKPVRELVRHLHSTVAPAAQADDVRDAARYRWYRAQVIARLPERQSIEEFDATIDQGMRTTSAAPADKEGK